VARPRATVGSLNNEDRKRSVVVAGIGVGKMGVASAGPQKRQRSTAMQRAMNDESKAQRRTQLLQAAKDVFAEKGYHTATMADVARSAQVSYGSVYWYFDSKDELFRALMSDCEMALRDHVGTALQTTPDTGDPAAPFRAAVQAAFEFFEADPPLVKLLFRDAQTLGRGIETHLVGIYEGFISDIERIVVPAQAAGAVIDAPPRMVAFSIAALVGQIALRRSITDDGFNAREVADFVVDMLLSGLRPRREPVAWG
jgi:AcrR family transcriptional regulator